MPLNLFRAPTSGIGIDLGTSYAKVVQLAGDSKGISLTTYVFAREPNMLVDHGATDAVGREAVLLRAMMQRAGVGRSPIVAALPILSVFSTVLQLPEMPERDMDAAVKIAAQSYVPSPLQDVVLGWTPIGKPHETEPVQESAAQGMDLSAIKPPKTTPITPAIRSSPVQATTPGAQRFSPPSAGVPGQSFSAAAGGAPGVHAGLSEGAPLRLPPETGPQDGGKGAPDGALQRIRGASPKETPDGAGRPVRRKVQDVFLTAAPRDLVSRYTALFDRLGVRLEALEVESFPLVRSLLPGEERPVLIVDLGDRTTSFSVVDGGYLRLNQAMDAGGAALTAAIETKLSLSREEAEKKKHTEGLSRPGSGPHSRLQTGTPQTALAAAIQPVLNEIIQRGDVLRRLYERKRGRALARIILIGGGARLLGIAEFWTEASGLPTEVGNPWRGIMVPKVLTERLRVLGPSFAVAAGLALRPFRKT